jgi:hypothetical protein
LGSDSVSDIGNENIWIFTKEKGNRGMKVKEECGWEKVLNME